MDAWMTSQVNVALIRKLLWSLICLAYIFDLLSRGVCTTIHWQTSSQLLQELNVCTVPDSSPRITWFNTRRNYLDSCYLSPIGWTSISIVKRPVSALARPTNSMTWIMLSELYRYWQWPALTCILVVDIVNTESTLVPSYFVVLLQSFTIPFNS